MVATFSMVFQLRVVAGTPRRRGFAPMTDQYLRAFRYLGASVLKSDDSLSSGRSRESEEKARGGEREPF
jgi:hypothetical protein